VPLRSERTRSGAVHSLRGRSGSTVRLSCPLWTARRLKAGKSHTLALLCTEPMRVPRVRHGPYRQSGLEIAGLPSRSRRRTARRYRPCCGHGRRPCGPAPSAPTSFAAASRMRPTAAPSCGPLQHHTASVRLGASVTAAPAASGVASLVCDGRLFGCRACGATSACGIGFRAGRGTLVYSRVLRIERRFRPPRELGVVDPIRGSCGRFITGCYFE
jgi:hypothetical protein